MMAFFIHFDMQKAFIFIAKGNPAAGNVQTSSPNTNGTRPTPSGCSSGFLTESREGFHLVDASHSRWTPSGSRRRGSEAQEFVIALDPLLFSSSSRLRTLLRL